MITGSEIAADLGAILEGNSKEIGDRQRREGLSVLAQELATTVGDELVDLTVCQSPDVVGVFLQPSWREQPPQQRTRFVVFGRAITTMCSKIGNSWRWADLSLMSSPSGVNGSGGTGHRSR